MNYPPGVTGSEPQITGEWPVDPHAPFDVVCDGVGTPDPKWSVVFGNEEDPLGGLEFDTQDEARKWADDLNQVWPLRECRQRGLFQTSELSYVRDVRQCSICFDVIGDPEEV